MFRVLFHLIYFFWLNSEEHDLPKCKGNKAVYLLGHTHKDASSLTLEHSKADFSANHKLDLWPFIFIYFLNYFLQWILFNFYSFLNYWINRCCYNTRPRRCPVYIPVKVIHWSRQTPEGLIECEGCAVAEKTLVCYKGDIKPIQLTN